MVPLFSEVLDRYELSPIPLAVQGPEHPPSIVAGQALDVDAALRTLHVNCNVNYRRRVLCTAAPPQHLFLHLPHPRAADAVAAATLFRQEVSYLQAAGWRHGRRGNISVEGTEGRALPERRLLRRWRWWKTTASLTDAALCCGSRLRRWLQRPAS